MKTMQTLSKGKASSLKQAKRSLKHLDKIHFVAPIVYSTVHPVNISIAGCGGTGSMVLRDLARMHVALQAIGMPGLHVSVYDPDKFSQANLGRQIMDEHDIGRNKAIVLVERINRTYGLQWNAYSKKFRLKSTHEGYNPTILITAVDSIDARRKIDNKYWVRKSDDVGGFLYWIDAGNGPDYGQVMLGTSKRIKQPKSKLYKPVASLPSPILIYEGLEDKPHEPSCSVAEALNRQGLMMNSMMAQIVSQMLWTMINYKTIGYRGVYLNLETMNMRPVKL